MIHVSYTLDEGVSERGTAARREVLHRYTHNMYFFFFKNRRGKKKQMSNSRRGRKRKERDEVVEHKRRDYIEH